MVSSNDYILFQKKEKSNKYLAFNLYSKDEPFCCSYCVAQICGSCGVLRWTVWDMRGCTLNCGAFVKPPYFCVKRKKTTLNVWKNWNKSF